MSTIIKPAPSTPTSFRDGGSSNPTKKLANPQLAAGLALNMSWQLLVAVVAPILGGYWLDTHFDTSNHVWMIAGMVLALGGMIAIVITTLKSLNELNGTAEETK